MSGSGVSRRNARQRGDGDRIGARPTAPPLAERWVTAARDAPATTLPPKADLYTARLTIDVAPELRARIKLAAFGRGLTVAEMLRALLEERFPAAAARTAPQAGNGREERR